MQISSFEQAPSLGAARSFAPSRGLFARFTWGRGEWFVRCRDDLLAIQLGPPRELRRAASEAPVLLLDPGEIAVVRRESELLAVPDGNGSFVRGAMVYVDLHLRHSRTEGLVEALAAIDPEDPARRTVRVLQPGFVRLVWEGPYHRMTPDASQLVDAIREAAGVAAESGPRQRSWQELSHEELGQHVLELQDAGRYGEAMEILSKRDAEDGGTEYVRRPDSSA